MINNEVKLNLKYGEKEIGFYLETRNIINIITSNKAKPLKEPLKKLERLLLKPINCLPLEQLVKGKNAQKILIIVNDITRPTPYHILLPPLLQNLKNIGINKNDITFLIATGAHRGNTAEENIKIFGKTFVSSYRFVNHRCDDEKLIELDRLASGNRLIINPLVKEADLIITTGVIVPHYIAGFSGGRKSIHPGICGKETIEKNHSYMLHPSAITANLIDNPAHEEMMEAALKVNVDFIINTVTDEDGNIIDIVAGSLIESWLKGVEICKNTYIAPIQDKADVVFVSAGGYPRDINIYQAQKALDNAYHAVKQGGTIVLLAECREGIGNSICEKWLDEANSIRDIEERLQKCFVLGGHKAYAIARVAKEADIILLSSLSKGETKKLFMKSAENIESAIKMVKEKHGNDFKSYIIPNGNSILPQIS